MRAIFLTTACLLISLTSIAAEKPQKKNNKPTQITSGTELAENLGDKQYHARHIMVESEPEAREIIAQLNLQTDFSKLIDKSKDAGSIEQGGSLGWVSPTDLSPHSPTLCAI
jgi:parvulin-like peptidyl-prolyl isomerase